MLDLLVAAWSAQRAAEQQQLEQVAGQAGTPGQGLANQEEFSNLVKQVRVVVAVACFFWRDVKGLTKQPHCRKACGCWESRCMLHTTRSLLLCLLLQMLHRWRLQPATTSTPSSSAGCSRPPLLPVAPAPLQSTLPGLRQQC